MDHKGNLYIRGPCCAHYRNEMFEATYLDQWRIMTEGLWWSVRFEREIHQTAWWCCVSSHGVMLRHRQAATNRIFLKQKVQTVMQDPVWWFCSIGLLSFAFNATFSHANTPHLLKCYAVYHLCLPIREGTRWLFPHYLEGKMAVSGILQYKLNSCLKDLKVFFEKPGCICTLIHMWSLSRVQQLCTVLPHWISNTIIIAWHHCSTLGSTFWCNVCSTISKLARYIATHFCSIYVII